MMAKANPHEKKNCEWEVEALLDKRLRPGGRFEYQVKWRNFPPSRATWEPVENLRGAAEVLAEFEKCWEAEQQARIERAKILGIYVDETLLPMGYERQLPLKQVVAATDQTRDGILAYAVEWQRCCVVDYVLADEVCDRDPQAAIDFYMRKLGWKNWGVKFAFNPSLKPDRIIGSDTDTDGRTKIRMHQTGVRDAKLVIPIELVRKHFPVLLLKYLNAKCFPRKPTK